MAVLSKGDGHSTAEVQLNETSQGVFEGAYQGPEIGLYRLDNGDQTAVIGLGPAAPREFVQTIASDEALEAADARLRRTRPTAINLMWALDEMLATVRNLPRDQRLAAAYARAAEICDADVETNHAIGKNGPLSTKYTAVFGTHGRSAG